MFKTLLKSILLVISIGISNSILFGILSFFYDFKQKVITNEDFFNYEASLLFMLSTLILSIYSIESFYNVNKISNKSAILIYCLVFAFIGAFTYQQFEVRPVEHGITFISLTSVLIARIPLNKWIKTGVHTKFTDEKH